MMTKTSRLDIHHLIDRLSRISAAEHWVGDLNPAQLAALAYLAKANQYSRAPSQVADYLSAMRGTVSNTLKALARKGLIKEQKSKTDRRRTSYTITPKGVMALNFNTSIDVALDKMTEKEVLELAQGIKEFIKKVLGARGDRSFGICATCLHHRNKAGNPYCALLKVALMPPETTQICFEHQAVA